MDMVTRAGQSTYCGLVHVHVSGGSYRTMDIVSGNATHPQQASLERPVNHITILVGPFKSLKELRALIGRRPSLQNPTVNHIEIFTMDLSFGGHPGHCLVLPSTASERFSLYRLIFCCVGVI